MFKYYGTGTAQHGTCTAHARHSTAQHGLSLYCMATIEEAYSTYSST